MNQHTSQAETPTTPFLAHLREHLPTLIHTISQQLYDDRVGPYQYMTIDQVRGQVMSSVQPYMQALTEQNNTPLAQSLSSVLRPSVIQQMPMEVLLRISAIHRSHALAFGLQAVADGITGAVAGVQQLMELFELATATISRSYQAQLNLFQTLAEYAPDGIGVAGLDGVVSYANTTLREQLGYGDEIIGMPVSSLLAPQDQRKLVDLRNTLASGESWRGTLLYQRKNQSQFAGEVSSYQLRDAEGSSLASVAIVRDITAQLAANAERQQLQQQVIEGQQAALAELSTPLIPISDQVMVMPLIGSIDSGRAGQLVERLLEGVVGSHASTAIIDITGVPVVDTQVAQTLLRAAQAARLVGARVVLTGIRPEVAQTLVGLGVDMGGIITRSTLQSGITYALGRG